MMRILYRFKNNKTDLQDSDGYGKGFLLIRLALLTIGLILALVISNLFFYFSVESILVDIFALVVVLATIGLVEKGDGYWANLLFAFGLMTAIAVGSIVTIKENRYSETENLFYGLMVMIIALFSGRMKDVLFFLTFGFLILLKYYRFTVKSMPIDSNLIKVLIIITVIALAIHYCTSFFKNQLIRTLQSSNKLNISLKRNEKKLRESNRQLQKVNSEKNEVIGIVAHDLKSPLNAIVGILPILQEGLTLKMTEEQKYLCQMINFSVERMNGMITKILDVNAIESDQINLHWENCDLGEIAQLAINNFSSALVEKEINLYKENIRPGLFFASLDRIYTFQILENLISNAIKFSPRGSTIHISLQQKGKEILILIKDQGPGICPTEQKLLFKRFTKLTARPTGSESSTGLGLSIVKRFVELMDGTIEVMSALGEGSTFKISFKASIREQCLHYNKINVS